MRTREFINEIIDKPVEKFSDLEYKNLINQEYKSSLVSGHTGVWQTLLMKDNGIRVVRIMDTNKRIQYHIMTDDFEPGEKTPISKISTRVGIDCLNIIYHDAVGYLDNGYSVIIMAPEGIRIDDYKKKTKSLLSNKKKDYKISDIFKASGVDGVQRDAFKINEYYLPKFYQLKQSVKEKIL